MLNESDKRLNLAHDKRMKPIMNINDLNTIEQMEQFLTAAKPSPFWLPAARMSATWAYSVRWLNSDALR